MTPTSGIRARGLEVEIHWARVWGGDCWIPINGGVEGQQSLCVSCLLTPAGFGVMEIVTPTVSVSVTHGLWHCHDHGA